MHVWTCNIPFPSTEPPTGVDPIANEDILFSESAGVEGMPCPDDLAKAWRRMREGKEVTKVLRFGTALILHCNAPDCAPKTLARFLHHNNATACRLPMHRASAYKFWMDLTCPIATVRYCGCWVKGFDLTIPNVTVFEFCFDTVYPLAPKSDF